MISLKQIRIYGSKISYEKIEFNTEKFLMRLLNWINSKNLKLIEINQNNNLKEGEFYKLFEKIKEISFDRLSGVINF